MSVQIRLTDYVSKKPPTRPKHPNNDIPQEVWRAARRVLLNTYRYINEYQAMPPVEDVSVDLMRDLSPKKGD